MPSWSFRGKPGLYNKKKIRPQEERATASFFIKLKKIKHPIKFFDSTEAAVKWLKE